MAEERKIATFTTPILVILLVIASFLVGMFWTKIRMLEGEKQEVGGEIAQVSPAPEGTPEEETVVLGEEAAAGLAEGPMRGNPDASVTIVEFSDFECPFSRRAQETLEQIFDEYGDNVNFVFRHFPLDFHKNAENAALASMCADEQDKFWEYHDILFANQENLTMANLKKWAADLDLDTEKFDSCLDSQTYKSQVDKDVADGQAVGVQGTPTFFINGQQLVGAQPFESFRAIIEVELAK